ncbi:MAG: hypothetical protein M1836_001075 [Candelina mexicana]|nr:MAG: hypothetical protein M1836_001075 [Candelina mexicana]
MENSQRNSQALTSLSPKLNLVPTVVFSMPTDICTIERVDVSVAQLAQRFENIIALAPVRDLKQLLSSPPPSNHFQISAPERNATAVDAYQLEVETAALIRAAEDILTLTRSLKEMWLFGQLDTIGESKFNERTEEAARGVLEGLQKVVEMREKGLNPDAGIRS